MIPAKGMTLCFRCSIDGAPLAARARRLSGGAALMIHFFLSVPLNMVFRFLLYRWLAAPGYIWWIFGIDTAITVTVVILQLQTKAGVEPEEKSQAHFWFTKDISERAMNAVISANAARMAEEEDGEAE